MSAGNWEHSIAKTQTLNETLFFLLILFVAWNIKAPIRHADKVYILFYKTRLLDKLNMKR